MEQRILTPMTLILITDNMATGIFHSLLSLAVSINCIMATMA